MMHMENAEFLQEKQNRPDKINYISSSKCSTEYVSFWRLIEMQIVLW